MITAQQAREIVNQSTIYNKIGEAASQGELTMKLDYMTREVFNSLTNNGYKVYLDNGRSELNRFCEELEDQRESFLVSWEG